MPPTEKDLAETAQLTALRVAARGDSAAVERRAIPARPATTDWNPVHLRRMYEAPYAVYDPLGACEIVLDARGKLWSLDDPRHAPTSSAVHLSEGQAVEAVLLALRASKAELDLEANLVRTRDGLAYLRVQNRVPKDMGSKFFNRQEEKPKGPPPDRIEADVNAATGEVYRLRRSPPPPEETAA